MNVALIHAFDPRGGKVGGIETFVRDYISYHPDDMNLLLIGVDGFDDLELGRVHRITVRGREIDFLPVMHVSETSTNTYASKLLQSLTFRFLMANLRYYPRIRRLLRGGRYSADLRRIEFSPAPVLMGVPFVQMLHDGMTRDKAMSSLLKRFWWVKEFFERFALRRCSAFFCVNSDLTARLKTSFPKQAHKLDTLPTWANETIFRPTPFQHDGHLNVIFAGRMDLFKRPDLMFGVIAALQQRAGNVRFHYVGDGDPTAFPEFAAIEAITVRHGRRNSSEIAALIGAMHMGILTSDFEGMPRVVMEILASGRPVVALHLPQLEQVIHEGRSGYLIPRSPDQIAAQADRMLETYRAIEAGRITPEGVAQSVAEFSPQKLLGKIWRAHRRIHGLAA